MIQIYDVRCTQEDIPQFSWKLRGNSNQVGYRIKVYNKSIVIWDSGLKEGGERHNIKCEFQLPEGGCYEWSVTCLAEDGSEDTANGSTFYTKIEKWNAQWIEPNRVRKPLMDNVKPHESTKDQADPLERLDPSVYMRRTFELDKLPERSIAYVTAHGIYDLWINGTQVSDLLSPGFTSYNKRVEYQCYDITSLLRVGKNVIGVILADGWYTGKIGTVGLGQQYGAESALLLQIDNDFAEGKKMSICSDDDFCWNTGAFCYADLFVGEYYDAEKELEGWLDADYNDQDWKPVAVKEYGYESLNLQYIPPVKVLRTITPKILRSPAGELILDAGETIVGVVSFSLDLKKGDIVKLEHSETLDVHGNYLNNIIGQNKHQTYIYICGTDGICSWQPKYTFHGFRYVRVTGVDNFEPTNYTIHVIGTDLEQTGAFTCSDDRLNKLQENIVRSQQGNMICIPTDCPQREKTGWAGDVQMYAPTACYEMDVEQFLRHWLQDMENDQLPDGQIPHIIPYFSSHDMMKPPGIEGVSAAGWSDAAIIVPWRLYEAYGDNKILKENFPMMCKYMNATEKSLSTLPADIENMSPEQLERQKYLWNTDFQFGDWLMPSVPAFEGTKLTGSQVATLMFIFTTNLMGKICDILGEDKLKNHYSELNKKVKEAFVAEYMNPDGTLIKELQGVYVLALTMDVVPKDLRTVAIKRLVHLIHENNDLLDTGFLSVPYLLPVLHENGEKALANKLLFRDECPSWLYEVKMGATTMWESWDCYAPDGTPSNNSMNHFAFGCVGEYMFRTLLGIKASKPGYSQVHIEPDLECGLTSVSGFYDSVWGKIEVSWKITGGCVELDVVIPPNVEAEIVLGNDCAKKYECGTWHIVTNI